MINHVFTAVWNRCIVFVGFEVSLSDLSSFGCDQEFLDGTSPRIYPWNQSKISNLKSSSPRIDPWGQSKI
jgi:hypothetical protein